MSFRPLPGEDFSKMIGGTKSPGSIAAHIRAANRMDGDLRRACVRNLPGTGTSSMNEPPVAQAQHRTGC